MRRPVHEALAGMHSHAGSMLEALITCLQVTTHFCAELGNIFEDMPHSVIASLTHPLLQPFQNFITDYSHLETSALTEEVRWFPGLLDPFQAVGFFYEPKYGLGHPENHLFLFSKKLFSGSKYPTNISFNFEQGSTGFKHYLAVCLSVCLCVLALTTFLVPLSTVLPLSIQTLCKLHRHVPSPNDIIYLRPKVAFEAP